MPKHFHGLILAGLVTVGLAGAACADTLLLQGIQQAQATAQERPSRGMTMQGVAERWGEPATRQSAVGQPPITRWDYADFTVYFEYEHVINAVPRHH